MNNRDQSSAIQICRVHSSNRNAVLEMLKKTDFFRPEELLIAQEVFDDAIKDGPEGDYQSYVAMLNDETVGWICFGQTPCTVGTYDIYWVVVNPLNQSQGIGKSLMNFAAKTIKERNGRMIVVDTSGIDRYISTRRFYEKLGYVAEHIIKDFYTVGDDMYIYIKRL